MDPNGGTEICSNGSPSRRSAAPRAAAAGKFAPGDVAAGRAFVAAYVPLMHYVEGVYALAAGEAHAHGEAAAGPGDAAQHRP